MKTFINYSIVFFVVIFCHAYAVKKRIPAGDYLYKGAKVYSVTTDSVDQASKKFNQSLKGIAYPEKNKMLFGEPYKVWWWYVIGAPKKEKGLKHWLRTRIGEPPVLFSTVDLNLNAKNMEAYLENEGYFNSSVSGDTMPKGYKMYAVYHAEVERPYRVDSINWRLDSSKLSKDLRLLSAKSEGLQNDKRYRVDDIKKETERISQLLREKGYYYFTPEHILTYVDTNHNRYRASLYLSIDDAAAAYTKLPYEISKVGVVVPGRSTINVNDSLIQTAGIHDSVYVLDPSKQFKSYLFPAAIVLRPGQVYATKAQSLSLTRLNSYGVFRFVKTDFKRTMDSSEKPTLNAIYYTTPYSKNSFQFEIGAFAKSNNYWGGEINFDWKNRNIFRGGEILSVRPRGSFEVSTSDSLKNNNTWRVGVETELAFPKMLVPGFTRKSFAYIPKTKIIASYDWRRREELYTEYYAHFRYELNWTNNPSVQHTVVPLSVTHRTSGEFTDDFTTSRQTDNRTEYAVPASFVPASSYHYIFSNTLLRKRKVYFLQAAVETSGFIFGLLTHNSGPFTTKIGDAQLMQYLRGEFEIRYSNQLGKHVSLFHRGMVGISYPYGNAVFLPFYKQFIIGGANSLRGFLPREIGPGTAKATATQINYYPQIGGDYKIELNSELRFPISGRLNGGFFVDAGNIWMKDTLLYSQQGKLTKDFWKEIAMDFGTGLRLDVTILVIRLDLGIPMYKPWLPEGDRWTFKDFDLGSSTWRKENLVLNFAIGHSF